MNNDEVKDIEKSKKDEWRTGSWRKDDWRTDS